MRDLASHFYRGKKWLAPEVLKRLKVPSRFGNIVLDILCKGNVMKCVNDMEGEYLPAKSLSEMNMHDVYYAIFGDDDQVFKNIRRKEYLELIKLNNEKLEEYVKDLSSVTFIKLVKDDSDEIPDTKT